MDKETAERLTKLETKIENIQDERKAWDSLIRDTVIKSVTWLIGVGIAGWVYGWHLPENVRKALGDWISK